MVEISKTGAFSPVPLIAFAGDSVTYAGASQNTSLVTRNDNRSHTFWVPSLTGQRVRTTQALNFGVAGDTTAQLLARIAPICACAADIVVVEIATNDVNNVVDASTFITTRANLIAIWDALIAAGKTVIVIPPLPRSIATAANRQVLYQIINFVRAAGYSGRRNFYVADATINYGDPLSATGAPRTDYDYDGLHPKGLGAYYYSKAIAAIINQIVPPAGPCMGNVVDIYGANYNVTGNLLPNGIMDGSTAAATSPGGNATGAGNTSASLVLSATSATGGDLAGLTATCSKVTLASGLPSTQVVLSGSATGGSDSAVILKQTVAVPANIVAGDIVEAGMDIEVDAGATNISGIRARMRTTESGSSYDRIDGANIVSDLLPSEAHTVRLLTPRRAVIATPTLAELSCWISLRQATAVSYVLTMRVSSMWMRKVL